MSIHSKHTNHVLDYDHERCSMKTRFFIPKNRFFLEIYQRDHDLPNFSATLERAAVALKREALKTGYEAFAADYSASTAMQSEAESWLSAPMLEVKP